MKNKEDLIKELIVTLSLSTIPPAYQDMLINKVAELSNDDLEKIINLINVFSQKEFDYLEKADNYLDFYNGNSTTLRDGLILTFDPNTDNEETVVLIDSSGNGVGPFQAIFQKAHSQDSSVINRGNPGPWVGYDRTKDRDVVPYAEIIE